jgi:hypothetical protein
VGSAAEAGKAALAAGAALAFSQSEAEDGIQTCWQVWQTATPAGMAVSAAGWRMA